MPSIFPWLNLPPPTTHGVSNEELPTHIQLGEHRLSLQPTGNWSLENQNTVQYTNQIAALNAKINELQLHGTSSSINKSAYELEKHSLELEKYNIELLSENERLKFQNKLLLAMCAISEGDYKKLCQEANWTNTSNTNTQHTKNQSLVLNDSIDTTVIANIQNNKLDSNKSVQQQRIPFNANAIIAG